MGPKGRGKNAITPFIILPQLFTPVMHFQREGQNPTLTKPVDRLFWLLASKTRLGDHCTPKVETCYNPYFAPKTKMGISAFSVGKSLAKFSTQNIAATVRDIGLVSKRSLIGNRLLRVQWSRDPKRSRT